MKLPDKQQIFLKEIENAESPEQLREIHQRLNDCFSEKQLTSEESIQNVYLALGSIHDAITQSVLAMAEKEFKLEHSSVTIPRYSWILMGSGGRKEQTFWTDQDNGMIYEISHPDNVSYENQVMKQLADYGVEMMNKAGYPLCPGNVMATNSKWRGTLSQWQSRLSDWMDSSSTESLQFLLIASDFRTVYGDPQLGECLRDWFLAALKNHKYAKSRLSEFVKSHEIPIGLFKQIFTERWGQYSGKFDIKYGLYVHLVNQVRLLAITKEIVETSTIERIDRLRGSGVWHLSEAKEMCSAFENALALRLKHAVVQDRKVNPFDYHVNLNDLKKDDLSRLKMSLKTAKTFQRKISTNEKLSNGRRYT